MGVVIKQSFWGTVISYLGVIVGYVNTLYFRAEYFSLAQIGLFTLVTAHAMTISPLSSFGMASSYLKFFPSFEASQRNRFFTFLLLITLIGNSIILITGYLLREQIVSRYSETAPDYIEYLSITGIIILVNSLFDLFFSYTRAVMKVIFPSFLRDIFLRMGSLFLVYGYALNWWTFDGAVLGLGIVYLSAFILLFIQVVLYHDYRLDFNFNFVNKEWKLKLLRFGSYSMLLAGSFALVNNITYDQVTAILGSDANGIFSTCFFIALIVEMPRRNMAKLIGPILSSESEKRNIPEIERLYKRSSITMTVFGMLLFIGILTNLNDLFDFIPKGEKFSQGFWVVVSVCLAKLLLMSSSFAGEVLNYSTYYRYNLIFQLLTVVTLIGFNHYFINLYGLNGAAISYLGAISIHILLKLLMVYIKFKIHPFYIKKHLTLLFIGILVGIIAYSIRINIHPIIEISIRSVITSVLFVSAIYYFKISEDINKLIHSTFERFLKINLPK